MDVDTGGLVLFIRYSFPIRRWWEHVETTVLLCIEGGEVLWKQG